MKNSTKSLINLLYLCCSMYLAYFILILFGRLLGAWLAWDMINSFPFSLEDLLLSLKLAWIGLPIGFVLWFFYYR